MELQNTTGIILEKVMLFRNNYSVCLECQKPMVVTDSVQQQQKLLLDRFQQV
jgi:hypothetical protein